MNVHDGSAHSYDKWGHEKLSTAEQVEKIDAAYRNAKARAASIGVDATTGRELAGYMHFQGLATLTNGNNPETYLKTSQLQHRVAMRDYRTFVPGTNPLIVAANQSGKTLRMADGTIVEQYSENWHFCWFRLLHK